MTADETSRPTRLALAALGPLLLAAPVLAQGFVDVTVAAGLEDADFAMPPGNDGPTQFTAGVAVADYDGDGWEDIFQLGGLLLPNGLWHNDADGTFTNVAPAAGLAVFMPGGDAKFADIDDDGDLDLYVTTTLDYSYQGGPIGHRNVLYRNEGDGTFTDITVLAGLTQTGRYGIAWGDLDGDLDLDLVAADWGKRALNPTRQFFVRNDGDFDFTDVTPANVVTDLISGFAPTIVDYDEDGDNDVFICADYNTSRLYRQDPGGVWTNVSDTVVDGGPFDDENGMGSAFGDFDNDGDIDWFVTSEYAPPEAFPVGWTLKTGNRMWVNNGDGTFTDGTDETGLRDGGWGWAADFGDLDNDGWLDAPHANGYYIDEPSLAPYFRDDTLRIFMNGGTGTFIDQAAALGVVDIDQGRGLALFDYDQDGRLDILVANNDVGLTLYRNEQPLTDGWLAVETRGTNSNHFGVGAKITLTAAGEPTQTRWQLCGDNYLSQSPYAEWFGTGSATAVDVRVDWPDGRVSHHLDLPVGQRVVLDDTEPTWQPLGASLAGTGGIAPALTGEGDLTGGSANALDVADAFPLSTQYLVAGLVTLDAPFKLGTLVPAPLVPPIALPTGPAGALTLPFSWPVGVPAGTDLFFQTWVLDPGGPLGFSASNALQATTP